MLRFLSALPLLAVVGCFAEEPAPTAPVVGVEGTYGVRYVCADDALSALDDTTVAAVQALQAVFATDFTDRLSKTVITIDDSLPEGIDGASRAEADEFGIFHVTIRHYDCPGNGSLAHELSHLASLWATGDGDAGHHNTKLFIDDCKTNACAWSTVEMVGRPLCQ